MVLNASGPISLAGATAGVSIAVELGLGTTTAISLNQAAVRTLAGVPSGAIVMPTNFYGKSSVTAISYTFTTSTQNASLAITAISGYVAGHSAATVTVNSGVYLWSSVYTSAGLTLTGGSGSDEWKLVNNGRIMGIGGSMNGSSFVSTPAGNAISISRKLTLTNNSYIGGGGAGAPYWGMGGGAGGGTGGVGLYYNIYVANTGGSGGAIGASGANGTNGVTPVGVGGQAGGGGSIISNYYCNCAGCQTCGGGGGGGGRIFPGTTATSSGGNGGGSNNAGTQPGNGNGGGGGWGASCGSGSSSPGKAIALNGNTITYVTTGNLWGAVS